MNRQSLSEITRGLQHAAQTTLSLVAEQFITMMEQFFEPLEDGTLQAKTVRVQISETSYVMVPLVALVTPRGVTLETMRVNLSVRLEEAESMPGTSFLDATEQKRTSFIVAMVPRGKTGDQRSSDTFDVELEFKAQEPPELIMRLIDMFTNTVAQTPRDPAQPLGKMPYTSDAEYQALLTRARARRQGTPPAGAG
jgi:hypothetical protein